MSAEIKTEWDKHASVYTSNWLKEMLSRGKYKLVKTKDEEKLLPQINNCSITEEPYLLSNSVSFSTVRAVSGIFGRWKAHAFLQDTLRQIRRVFCAVIRLLRH